jgi:P-type E1-E2 ATPase
MIEVAIPGRGALALTHLVLDMNGTIALDGAIAPGVAEDLADLRDRLSITLLTADTHGTAAAAAAELGIGVHRLDAGDETAQKAAFVERVGASGAVAIGNGANDAAMLAAAALGICVLGGEGAATSAWSAADVVAGDIRAALGLLRNPRRLVATLRR